MKDTKRKQYFMDHEQMDFETQIILGSCHYGAAEEGANWHCEPKARGLYDQRMFDWLATVMPS